MFALALKKKTTATTVTLRPEDVQAIDTGWKANSSVVAAVALKMQSDSQQAVSLADLPASSSRSQTGMLKPITGSPHKPGTCYCFSSLHTGRDSKSLMA